MNRFWIVWREGSNTVTHKHLSEQSAEKEAERLANLSPGCVFHVMEVKGSCKKKDVVWRRPGHVDDDYIPF